MVQQKRTQHQTSNFPHYFVGLDSTCCSKKSGQESRLV